jgi:hypothetical protein
MSQPDVQPFAAAREQTQDVFRTARLPVPEPQRLDLLAELQQRHARDGLWPTNGPTALHATCPNRNRCWKKDRDRMPAVAPGYPGPGEYRGIFFPWIGPRYEPGGICLLLVNLNITRPDEHWWTPAIEYVISTDVSDELHTSNDQLFGNPTYRNMLTTAHTVLLSLDGEPVTPQPPSMQDAAVTLDRTARVQSVRCSPVGGASRPPAAMTTTCPPRFAHGELDLLKPGVVVAMGQDAWPPIHTWRQTDVEWVYGDEERYMRDRVRKPWGEVDIFWLCHPAERHGTWRESQQLLVDNLIRTPLSRSNGR